MAKTIIDLQADVGVVVGGLKSVSFAGYQKRWSLGSLFAAAPSSFSVSKFDRRLQEVVRVFEQEISVANRLSTCFSCVARLEEKLSIIINQALRELDRDQPIGNLRQPFSAIAAIEQCLGELNILLSHYLRDHFETIIQELDKELAHDLSVIRAHFHDITDLALMHRRNESTDQLAIWQDKLSTTIGLSQWLLLATLLKGSHHAPVCALIRDLSHNVHGSHDASRGFNLLINLTLSSPTITVSADMNCILKTLDLVSKSPLPSASRIPASTEHALGGSSTFLIDVQVSMHEMDLILRPEVFNQLVDRVCEPTGRVLLSPITEGGMHLDRDHNLQYVPNQVILLHEWIHVSHNQQGRNLKSQPLLDKKEEDLWGNMEEYATLCEGVYNENNLLAFYGANPRLAYMSVIDDAPEGYPLLHLDRATNPEILDMPLQAVIDVTIQSLGLAADVSVASKGNYLK